MNKDLQPISDAHIHAYVDDELNQKRRDVVEDYVVALPVKCAQVRAYRKINDLMRQSFNLNQIPYKHRKMVSSPSEATSNFRLVRSQKTVMLIGIILGVISGWLVINSVSAGVTHNEQSVNQFKLKFNQATTNTNVLHIVE